MASTTMTLEGRNVLKEGWMTLFKSKKAGIFSSKPAPDKQLDRGWAVLHQFSSKGPFISFYLDNRKESKVMKKEKLELMHVKGVTRMLDHPKHPHCFTLKLRGSKRVLLNVDTEPNLEAWLKIICELTKLEYKREKVIWEYYDGGLWNALSDGDSFRIEGHYCDNNHIFNFGDAQMAYQYNLHHMTRTHPRTRVVHRIKRTILIEERPEVLHSKMADLPAIWEWGDPSKQVWHPFERDTNIQIEEMYDSGSQWAELTLCLPSPMPFLLDLHDMKLVNFRTAVRYSLRRVDNSDYMHDAPTCPEARSPSPDDLEDQNQPMMVSPLSPIFKSLQDCLEHLQITRKSINYKSALGEGAFGEVFLAEVTGLPGYEGDKPHEVAVKQLRLSDFIARHGHHSQQMEDFLREAKEMSKVDHFRVVKLIAVCTRDYPLLLIEEYMNQGDLLGVLKDSRPTMPLTKQLNIAHQVADGMDYLATGLNTVHRDLAARNILVKVDEDNNIHAKVADFGLSRHLYSEMYKHQGTKPRPLPAKWMALESLMYFIFTSKSDVWSFGVLVWEIMSLGRTPYPGVENRELLEQIEEKGLKLSKPRPCPTVIYEMILDCTQHEPEERPTFAELRDKMQENLRLAENGELECSDSAPNSPSINSSHVQTTTTTTEDDTKTNTEDTNTEDSSTNPSNNDASSATSPGREEGGPTEESSSKDNTKDEPKSSSAEEPPSKAVESETVAMNSDDRPPSSPKRTPPQVSPKPVRKERSNSKSNSHQTNGVSELTDKEQHNEAELVDPEDISIVASEDSTHLVAKARQRSSLVTVEVVEDAEVEETGKITRESYHEVAGPLGHLYYLLDPLDEDPKKKKRSKSPEKPPLPNHKPVNMNSVSPAHRANSLGNSEKKSPSSSPSRPKAHTLSGSNDSFTAC